MPLTPRRFLRIWICVLFVWTLSLITPGTWFGQVASTKVGEVGLGKLLHFGIYAALAGSAGWLPLPLIWRLTIALPLLSAHGAMTEVMQLLVPAREGCVRDWMIDTAGIMLGFAIAWRWWPADHRALTPPGSPRDSAAGTR